MQKYAAQYKQQYAIMLFINVQDHWHMLKYALMLIDAIQNICKNMQLKICKKNVEISG